MLERLRLLIQNRNANTDATEEGNSNCHKKSLAASSPALARQGQCTDCHRTQSMPVNAEDQEKSSSKIWGFNLCRTNRDVSIGDGENVRTFWSCCGNCKVTPQSYKPLKEMQESKSTSKMDRLTVHPSPMRRSTETSIATESTNTTVSETAVSSETLVTEIPLEPSIQSEQTNLVDLDAIINIMEYAHSGDKSFLDNNEDNITFLRAISANCMAAHKNGQDTLELPYTKNELTETLVMVMETLPIHSVPSFILSCSMLAVYNLSKFKPPLDPELESCILRFALHGVFNMETEPGNAHSQALYQSSSDTLDIMLKGLLSEAPNISHLLCILEHIGFWIHSKDVQERSRAITCGTTLLHHAAFLQDFDKSHEIPALGHHVAQFGLCLTDPEEDVNHQARMAIAYLYELLLHQMGLNIHEAGELWCEKSNDKNMLGYIDACRVGEHFRKIFTEDQKRTFLQTTLLAIYHPLRTISEAAVLLVYSLLRKENEIMREKAEETRQKIYKELYVFRTLRKVPPALQSVLLSKGDVMFQEKTN